jgi:hypothetical protein
LRSITIPAAAASTSATMADPAASLDQPKIVGALHPPSRPTPSVSAGFATGALLDAGTGSLL